MNKVKIPFSALTADSALALVSVNTNTKMYGADGKPLDGVKGNPKVEVCALDSLTRFTVSVNTVSSDIAALTEADIEASLQSREYYCAQFSQDAYANPYPNKSGYGVTYSIKALSVELVK